MEGDPLPTASKGKPRYFYPRPPHGGRLDGLIDTISDSMNFYPRPPHGGRQGETVGIWVDYKISIHALRMEGDAPYIFFGHAGPPHFYPRPPHGGRLQQIKAQKYVTVFLSTPSAWRATAPDAAAGTVDDHFYPRPPHGGRHLQSRMTAASRYFYPRPPHGGRRTSSTMPPISEMISIHALRMEGDGADRAGQGRGQDFYPRPPHGGRPVSDSRQHHPPAFLSTPSAWRATIVLISDADEFHFYPRPPHGGRQAEI